MTRLVFVVVPALALLSICECAPLCDKGEITQTEAEGQILKLINEYRLNLLKGKQKNGVNASNLLPAATNMNKLVWDCGLETQAMSGGESTCPDELTAPPPTNNALIYMGDYDSGEDITSILTDMLSSINNVQLTDVGGEVRYSGELGLKDYANLMRSSATKIGCHMKRCPDVYPRYGMYCLTDAAPVANGTVIYQKANGTCVCTTNGYACDTDGFCAPKTTTTSTTATTTTSTSSSTTTSSTTTTTSATQASGAVTPSGPGSRCSHAGMTDALRNKFLDMHNYRRSLLALGKCAKNNGNLLKSAQNMKRMEYNCDLEAEAIAHASKCPNGATGGGTEGMNFYRESPAGVSTFEAAVQKVVTTWWKVVRQYPGIGMQAMFRQHHVGTPITSFTQMAWATSNQLGCAIVKCESYYIGVCKYSQRGNIAGTNVYVPGKVCGQCSGNCIRSMGLCP